MRELFLFVRPPRPLWPFNGPSSAFWQPLAFASLAAALREKVPDLQVAIFDAPALHKGWRSLETEIFRLRPAYVGIGEEAVSCKEGLRLAGISKACGAQVIAGGCFFGHVAAQVLGTGLVDAVVHGEGEVTIVELVQAIRSGKRQDLRQVKGISFADGEGIVTTPHRELLPNLDDLPFPAYDLLPVDRYGLGSRNHPDFAAIELGRGCFGSCDFCVLWRQMGHFQGDRSLPSFRIKSPERGLEEIRILVRKFGRRYLRWVDPCFNAHPEAPGRLAEMLLREGIRVGQSAWVRADGIVRDEGSGALSSCVRAGLNEVYIGIERPDSESLRSLRKASVPDDAREALAILSKNYPQVFTVGSFIYGLPGDTPETMKAIYRFALELDLDMPFYIPLAPLPGTPYWRPELWDSTGESFRAFDFLPYDKIGEQYQLVKALFICFAFDWPAARFRWYLRRVFGGDARKRRLNRRVFAHELRLLTRSVMSMAFRGGKVEALRLPRWYEN